MEPRKDETKERWNQGKMEPRKDGTKERWKNGCKVGWNQGRMEPGTKEDWSHG